MSVLCDNVFVLRQVIAFVLPGHTFVDVALVCKALKMAVYSDPRYMLLQRLFTVQPDVEFSEVKRLGNGTVFSATTREGLKVAIKKVPVHITKNTEVQQGVLSRSLNWLLPSPQQYVFAP